MTDAFNEFDDIDANRERMSNELISSIRRSGRILDNAAALEIILAEKLGIVPVPPPNVMPELYLLGSEE